MIGSVAIQRLLENAILLTLERGTRRSDAQSSTASKSLNTTGAAQQLAPQPAGIAARGTHFTQASTWSNAPVIPAEIQVATVAASTLREAAVAPLAYRETVSDTIPGARLPDQNPIPANTVPAPIQYAHPELALALSRTKSGAPATSAATDRAIAQSAQTSNSQSTSDERALAQQAKRIALIAGSAAVVAALAVMMLG